ncbi:MAG: uL13 family ribosomal protein [Candidatus Pacebacteria bacterium]|jgi:large subunit ribosomal protein L13|nr:uL13 family ribosomal protein [Candidatus Paceibacterota bacterium]
MAATIHTIDAKGKRLGRVASLAATYLMGKHRADFVRHKSPDTRVVIENAGKLVLTESKKTDTVYKRFSGHQGSKVKIETLSHLAERKGYKEGLKLAIRGMLPNNKLRPELLKRLTITD